MENTMILSFLSFILLFLLARASRRQEYVKKQFCKWIFLNFSIHYLTDDLLCMGSLFW